MAWYKAQSSHSFSQKNQITYLSNGARIATASDMDGDGILDVISASYYDHTVGWYKNNGNGVFSTVRAVSTAAFNAQGVHAADLDNDGDVDLASASSGDNRIVWYENLGDGRFCEISRVLDDNALGARTVISVDVNNDGESTPARM